jgi:hypothetical protein
MFGWLIRIWHFLFSGRPSPARHVPAVPITVEKATDVHESSPQVNQPKHVARQGVSSAQSSSAVNIQEPEVLPAGIPVYSKLVGPKRQREWVDEIETKLEKSRQEAQARKLEIERMERQDRDVYERVKMRQEAERKLAELKERANELIEKIYHNFAAIPKASNCEDAASIDEMDSRIEGVEELIKQHREVMSELQQFRKDRAL